jgi:hypothetical protein
MDSRNQQYEFVYGTASDIGLRFGRTPNGHFWGRIILRLFGELLEQDDEFIVECKVNGLVEQYVGGSDCDYPGDRADLMCIFMEWLDEIRQYPAEVSKAGIESYLYPPRRAQYRRTGRYRGDAHGPASDIRCHPTPFVTEISKASPKLHEQRYRPDRHDPSAAGQHLGRKRQPAGKPSELRRQPGGQRISHALRAAQSCHDHAREQMGELRVGLHPIDQGRA